MLGIERLDTGVAVDDQTRLGEDETWYNCSIPGSVMLLLLVQACQPEAPPCGEGTHAKDGVCVADEDTAVDSGDSATDSDADADSDSDTDADSDTDSDTDSDSDTDADSDSDSDADADSDSDSDTDSDSDSDTDTGTETADYTVCATGGLFTSIQDAIDAAADGDVITVCAGTYVETLSISGAAVSLVGSDGAEATIVDADKDDRVLTVDNGQGASTEITGFTFSQGETRDNGGGIYLDNSSPYVHDCIVTDNEGDNGGGIALNQSDATLDAITVTGNYASGSGGGLWVSDGAPTLGHLWVEGNEAGGGPGAIRTWSTVTLYNSVFTTNVGTVGTEASDGAAIVGHSGGLAFNNVFAFNTGGGGNNYGSVYVGSAFYNNVVYDSAGGISYSSGSVDYNDSYLNDYGNYVSYGGTLGANNLELDPRFNDATRGDFSLDTLSPCIDAGNPASGYDDLDGTPNDIGAYGGPYGAW